MNNDFKPLRPRHEPQHQKPKHISDTTASEPPFEPPEQVAAHDHVVMLPQGFQRHAGAKKSKGSKLKFWHHLKHLDRKQKLILGGIVAVLLIASGVAGWALTRKKPATPSPAPVAKQEEAAPEPPPTTVPSRLTGVHVPPELDALPNTAVMIENSPDARPQAGLRDAGVVFEAIAEGGITRFLAIFHETKPGYIGPVRSVRPYYLDFLTPFDAPIAHAGGSAQALAEIRSQGLKDLDHGANGSTYQRVSNRFAPHNLYTSREKLLQAHNSKGWNSSTFDGFSRKGDQPVNPTTAKIIDFSISGFLYNPHFDYDGPTNSYVRSEGGKAHLDEKSGQPINPKVIIALVMSHRYAGIYSVYGTTGSGPGIVFQDGSATAITWKKTDRKSQFKFVDANDNVVGLNAGQTWISIVSSASAITFKP